MEPNRVQFLENKTLLVTGASGFLSKVFVERVLSLQPNVKKLYLLVRASGNKSAEQRLHEEVFEKDLFKVLRKNIGDKGLKALISEKVVPVPGDVTLSKMGVTDSNLLQDMMQEIDIVFHAAATTRFDERYDVALRINTFGALNVLNFAKKSVKAQLLLHVSTAYVCGEKSGLIQEIPFAMGDTLQGKNKVDINTEKQLVEQRLKQLVEQGCSEEETKHAMRDLGLKRAKLFGLPNTYAFTKVMGEMFLGHYRENMPIVVIRPSVITSTFLDPFPGWIEGVKTIDAGIVSYGKGMLKCLLVDQKTACDIIPVDMVANAMIATAAEHFHDSGSHTVYHVASSYRNPIIFKQIAELMIRYFKKSPLVGRSGVPIVPKPPVLLSTMTMFRLYTGLHFKIPLKIPVDMVANAMIATAAEHFHDSGSHTVYHVASSYRNPIIFKQIAELMIRYFKKSPLVGRSGVPIVPKPPVLLSTMTMFRLYTGLHFKIPLKILGLLSKFLPSQFGDIYQRQNRKFEMNMRLVKLYEPYLLFKGVFDDKNLEILRIKNEAEETNDLPGFSPKCIDWEDYFINTHFPGLVTHVLNK